MRKRIFHETPYTRVWRTITLRDGTRYTGWVKLAAPRCAEGSISNTALLLHFRGAREAGMMPPMPPMQWGRRKKE